MELLTPDIGLVVWSTIAFLLLLIILRKFAWKPIVETLTQREESIHNALSQAEQAREEMRTLTAKNEEVLKEAKEERNNILREANKVKDKIIADAKEQSQLNNAKMMADAKEDIETQKKAVMADLKNAAAELSLSIAEKVLSKELSDKPAQAKYINEMAEQAKLN